MIKNRNTQQEQSYIPSSQSRKHNRVRTLQTFLTALTMLFALGVNGAWGETAMWNFRTMSTDVNIQGKTGEVVSDVQGVTLSVDATVSQGALKCRGGDAQFNNGTIIRVPVVSTNDVVTVVSYPNYHYYTINSKAAEADTEQHTATSTEVSAGYVEIVATSTAYLYSISVEQHQSPATITQTATWNFCEAGSAITAVGKAEGQQDGIKSYPSDVAGVNLSVDATNGKFAPRGTDVQVSANTIIKIPVVNEADVITITNYSASSNNVTYTIGNEEATNVETKPYSPTAAEVTTGYVVMTVTGSGYMRNISVVQNIPAGGDPELNISKTATTLAARPLSKTVTDNVKVTGKNLTVGTVITPALDNAVTGLSISPTSVTVEANGTVEQTFTITYSATADASESLATYTFNDAADEQFVSCAVTYSATVAQTAQTSVSEATTWTWNDIYKQQIELAKITNPSINKSTEIDFADLYPYIKTNANFNASALMVKANYPVYGNSTSAYFHGNQIKFTTTVAGKVKITKFASGGGDERSITINGTNVGSSTSTSDFNTTATEVSVDAGDVTILGSNEVRIWEIVFTPSAADPDPIDVPEFSLAEEESVINTKTPAEWGANKVQLPSIPAITASNVAIVSGLVSDADNTATLQAALNAVPAAGGMVIIPKGTWLSGPLTIKSKTVLHLCKNTTLKMLPYASYPIKEVKDGVNQYADFITASAGDVVIEGESKETSIIEGQGSDWWRVVEQDDANETTTFKRGSAIRFTNGSKYLVRNIRLQNTPGTNITLGQSAKGSHFTIHDVVISNPASDAAANPSHNTDGIPVWGPYVNIYNCNISTGDDNVVFDSQSAYGHVWDCTFGKGHGASIGSYTVGVHDILWDNITFDGTESGFKIKSQRGRSGDVYNITAQNSTMTGVRDILMLDCWYDKKEMAASPQEAPTNVTKETTTPAYHDITFKNITATDCFEKLSSLKEGYPVYIYGLPESPIKNVTFDNVTIEGRKGMFMAFANGINFTNDCNITNVNSSTAHIATQYLAEWNGSYVTTAPSYPRTAKWNFRNPIPQALQGWALQGGTDTHILTSDIQTVQMVVDATSGKLWSKGRDDWAQFNTGTKLRVPVYSTSDEVTVTTNSNAACTVGGDSDSGKTVTHIATMEEVADGFVEVIASKDDYLGLVQVVHKEPGTDLSPTWNEAENRWEAKLGATPAENAESMLFAISFVKNKEVKTLYLPNGTYDLGTEHNKLVPDGMTIIGESRDGVIIKNRPTLEGIGVTATLQTGSNVTLKNLTLNCRAPFADGAERGVCLQEGGSATSVNHYENIVLDGLQDTYYSNGAKGMTSIFDNCIIRGTVDFICGNGNVTFNDCKLQLVKPHNGAAPIIAAPATYTDGETGFVFNRCTVEAATTDIDCAGTGHATGDVTDYYLARAWYAGGETLKGTDRTPKAAFNGTTYTLAPNDTKWGSSIGYSQDSERREFSDIKGSDLTVVNGSIVMGVGDTHSIVANTDYTTSSTGDITYESSKSSVVTVSEDGVITAVGAGTATITITQASTAECVGKSVEITVTVRNEIVQKLIEYEAAETVPDGITLGGTTAMASVKIHENKDATNCIQLANGYTTSNALNENYITIKPEGGIKAGDVISLAGFFNNADNTKVSKVDIFVKDAEGKVAVLSTTNQFINGRTSADDPSVDTYTFVNDYDAIYLGRNGGTGTNLSKIVLTRTIPSGATPSDLAVETAEKTMEVGDTYTIVHTTSGTGAVTYESSDEAVATVSDAGVITAVAAGSATITINQAADATYAAGSCEIAVTVEGADEPSGDDYNNVAGTITWAIGNEAAGSVSNDITDAVSRTKVTVGTDLKATTLSSCKANSKAMPQYEPNTSNPGNVTGSMVEYIVRMKKGVTFKPTSISYDAVKCGTDNASYSWSYTIDGSESSITTVAKDNIIRDNNTTGSPALNHIETINSATAGQTVTVRFYVSGFSTGKNFALGNVKINGIVNGTPEERTFQDFKIDFRPNPYTVILPDNHALPEGVSVDGTHHDSQHGYNQSTITIPVDGPVKLTFGSCNYGSPKATIVDASGKSVTVDTNNGCDSNTSFEHFVTWTYNNETPTTLTVTTPGFIPFFYAEACEYIPTVDVTYYDTDGTKVIGKETVEGSSALAYAYGESNVTVPEGSKFRGWFDRKLTNVASYNGKKVAEGTVLNEDLKLYAIATPIEVATPDSRFNYDLTKDSFYKEDHEAITIDKGKYYNSHGWLFENDGTIKVPVSGNADLRFTICCYTSEQTFTITDEKGTEVGTIHFVPEIDGTGKEKESAPYDISYVGPATTLTFTLPKGGYIHEVEVYNKPIPESDLAIVEGKDVITLNPGSTYQLMKGEENDYTTSSEAAMTYESDNTEMVTVSETGLLTAGTGFGQATITMTQAGNDKFQTGSVSFTVKVVSAHGQTAKPTATVGEDGKVYLTGNILDSEAKIYYTTNGDEPTTASTEYNGEAFIVSAGTIVKAIAIHDDKSPSDIVTAYYKIPATLKWSGTKFDLTYEDESVKPLFDANTALQLGSKLNNNGSTFSTSDSPAISFAQIASKEVNNNRDKDLSLRFNVLMKAGMSFKPSAISFVSSRGGTNSGKLDVTYEDADNEAVLFTDVTPNRCNSLDASPYDGSGKYHTQYNYSDGDLSSFGFSEDASLYIYQKGLGTSYYGYTDITITGLVSGSLYDGEFYNVGYDVEPAEGGYVVQKPSVSSVMAGKTVVFNATPAEGYKFINWTKAADGTVLSTDKTFNRTITEDTYIKANFQKIPLVTFSKEGLTDIDGNVPTAQYVDADTYELSIPANYVLYKEGSTMIGWAAGDKTYRLGESHRFDADVTLKPKFQRNEVAITDINEKVTVRWDFNHRERSENSPELNVYTNDEQTEKSTGIYTRTAMVNGVSVDMKMDISAPLGGTKLDNRDMTVPVTAAQVNPGTTVTIPAVPGMKVILKASEDKDTRDIKDRTKPRHTQFVEGTTIPSYFGNDPEANHPTRVDDYTAEYIYNGNDETVTLTFQQISGQGDWGFYEWIEVEYPVLQDVKLFNSITDKLDREKNENAGTLEITAKDPEHANTGKRYLAGDVVTISATAKYGYTITGFKHNETLLEEGLTIADGGKSATVSYTVVDGDNTVYAVYERQTTYPVRVTTADLSLGEVTLDPIYENFVTRGKDYIEGHYVTGTEVKLKSEAGEGNVLSYWMDGAETWKDGDNPTHTNPNVDIIVGTDAEFYTAYFRPGEKGTVIFDMTGSGVYAVSDPNTYSGSVSMNPVTLSGVRSFNIPTNFTFFKPGWTLEHWLVKGTDATYELGQRGSFTTPNQTITLVPVFRENTATQENRTNNPVIRYDFGSGIFNYDDPTKGETRKVSAQKVNIPKNTKTFWTSKVWTEVLVDGNPDKNWRDVAMWVNTGEKGFVRNGDLPDWAAFGPGTTFEVASGSGTKFSLMTYAPITTTTIDGVVPELDEARSNPANHEYVYTYTTRSAEDRVKIVIGNDYSYYKWLEAATLAANMVDLHIKTTDNVVGEVTSVKSWDEENYPSKDLDDGGHSFQKGNKVVVTFYRKFGAEFKQIIDPAKDNLPILEMLDEDKVRMVRLGDGTDLETLEPNNDGTWGGGNDHVFKLTKSDVDETEKAKGFLTKYVVEFEITNHRNLEIQFKEKPTYYVTYNTGTEAVGVAPSAAWVEAGDYYKISKNQTLYYEGHTLDHWVDLSGNVYNIGQNYQMSPTSPRDMLLYPIFRQNTFSLLDLKADTTATWELGRGNGAPVISYQRINGIYIAQVSNGESDIDVKLDLMGVNGKIDNKSYEERAQINEKSAFFFPVTEGCEVRLASSSPSNQIETTKIFRKDAAAGGYEKGQIVTATYSGVAGQDSVVFANDGKYYTQFSITYKAQEQTAQPALTSVKYGETTLTADQFTELTTNGSITLTIDPDVNTNRVPAITAVVENGKAEIEQATYQNPVATVTLKTQGGMSIKAYAINFDFSVPATAPKLSSVKVKNATVTDYVANNAPVSGSIEITFDRIMKAASVTPASPGESLQAISAPQGKTLTFNYWHLPVDKEVTITIPANTLEDVYGKAYAEPITLTLHTAATNMDIEHKPFDYVVGYGEVSDLNAIIKAVNSNRETGRLRIFIPDGEYELTGNEKSSWKAGDETTDDNGVSKKIEAGGFKYDNHMTVISRTNVSLIGQSQENTIIFNRPKYEGIGCTATIHVTGVDDYLEDLTLENRFPYYKANFAGRAVAFWDQGNRQVLKNVSLLSYQDTYYSHGNGNYRGYFEDCVLAGTVDWLCGNGDIWLERCGIMIRNRSGNNIAAPATVTPWGYVFNNCRIYPEEGADLVVDKSYTLGRPWQGTPSATYLNTTFDVLPRDEGWQAMMESHVLKFHEYGSMDSYGHPISLGSRTLAGAAPLKGSDDLILTEEAASKYTIENVLGGGEAFDPRIYTQQIDAVSGGEKDANNTLAWDDQIEIDDDRLQWRTEPMALCYFVFKLNEETGKWEYKTNIAQSTEDETMTGLSLEPYGNGFYCVRAANQRGGLGTPTEMIEYTVSEKYTLTIKEVGNTPGYGWSTICLPYNSKVPTVNAGGEAKDLKIYAANGDDSFNKEEIVDNYTLYLTPVDVINKNMGYVVYGPVGDYTFSSSSHTSDVVTILSGNPKVEPIPVGNNNSYVLANKTTYGLGFYKFTGATLAANRAWLPVDMVETGTQTGVNTQAKAITFFFVDYDAPTGLYDNIVTEEAPAEVIYDTTGRRIGRQHMRHGGIYIINGQTIRYE